MLLDLIPSKYIMGSLGVHAVLVGGLVLSGNFNFTKRVSLMEPNQGSVEVLFSAQPEEIQQELKKHIKKIIKQKQKKVIADVGDKIEKPVEEVQAVKEIRLEDIKSLSNLSPEMKAFLKSLKNKIQERQVYPYAAKRLRQTGQVVVKFDVLASGDVNNVSIEKKSDHKRLNASAFNLIAGISKVKSPPKTAMRSDKISIVVPIEYRL
jgi:protein TonB